MFHGKTVEFDRAKENWVSYFEGMTDFFEANGIEEETIKKKFLWSAGAQRYKLLKSLSVPSKSAGKSFQELVPSRSKTKFNSRKI